MSRTVRPPMRRAKLGDDHPNTLYSLSSLANRLFAGGQPEMAVPLAREFLSRAGKLEGRFPARVQGAIPEVAGLLFDHYRALRWDDLAELFQSIRRHRLSIPPDGPARAVAASVNPDPGGA